MLRIGAWRPRGGGLRGFHDTPGREFAATPVGHARETPIEPERRLPESGATESPERHTEAREAVGTVSSAIPNDLTRHQREALVAMTIQDMAASDLAGRLQSTSGALCRTLHDPRRKLRAGLKCV